MPDRDRHNEKQVETAEKRCPKKSANGIIIDIPSLDMLSFSYARKLGAENKRTIGVNLAIFHDILEQLL